MAQAIKSPEGWLGEIKDWQIVQANKITYGIGDIAVIGKVLIGPHSMGGQAFIPPGVWSNTPEGFEHEVTDMGWRHGIYKSLGSQAINELAEQDNYPVEGNESKLVWVTGMERPLKAPTISLRQADETIAKEAPREFADFAKEITANRARQLQLKTIVEDKSVSEQELKTARNELNVLQAQAAAAFGQSWLNQVLNNSHLIKKY